MKSVRFGVVLAVCAVTVVSRAFDAAQEPGPEMRVHTMEEAKPDIVFPEGKDRVRLPFRRDGNHIVLGVSVNGSKPLSLVLDTGMPSGGVMLYENDVVKALGLPYGDVRVRLGGAGGGAATVEGRMAEGIRVALGDLELKGLRAVVMPPIREFPTGTDGVIGGTIFRNFTVRIDQDAGAVELMKPGAFHPPDGAVSVPIEMLGPVPGVRAEVAMTPGGAPFPVTLVVDLGGQHALHLLPASDPRIAVPQGALQTRVGRGLSGAVEGAVSRISSFSVGGISMKDVVTGFPSGPNAAPRGLDSRNGNLGMGILGQLNVTFDYAGRKLWIERSRRFGEAFEWDMSGLVLDPADGGLGVASVAAGSPASDAGLKAGDRIVKVDGEAVSRASFLRVRELFRRNGARVEVTYTRSDETKEVTLKLRRIV